MTTTISQIFADIGGLPMLVFLAKATLILLLALGVTVAMQRASAGARHLVWLVALATLLLVPALTAWAPFRVHMLPASLAVSPRVVADATIGEVTPDTRTDKASIVPTTGSQSGSSSGVAENASLPPATQNTVTQSVVGRFSDLSLVLILLLIWAAVVVIIGASLGYAALVVQRIVRHAKPLSSSDWTGPLFEVADRLGLDDVPRLLRSEEAKMPFACGVLTPTIVLPAECDDWNLDRRRAVLLHELAHVRRHDLVGHTLGRLACAFYWFHPLVWTAAKRLRSESERACDDLALSCGARATDYAEHLLDIVTSVRRDATPSVALAMARRKEFEGRMLAILDPELRHSSPSRRQSATLIGSLALIAIVVGAAAPAPRVQEQVAEDPAVAPQSDPAARAEAAFPDSPEIFDGTSMKVRFDKRIDQHTSTQTTSTMSPAPSVSPMVQAFSNAVGKAAASVAQSVVSSVFAPTSTSATATAAAKGTELLKIIKQEPQQKGVDDRPILLAKVLKTDTSASLRRIAAWGLEEYADAPVAVEALSTALRRDASAGVREMAAWALASGDDSPTAIDALTAALKGDAAVRVRAISAWALGEIDATGAVPELEAALSDAAPEVRMRALWAIGQAEPKQAPRGVIALLADKDPRTRELAAWALYQIEDPAAIPALEAALRAEKSRDLQMSYIKALAATGEKSVDALRGLIESPDPEIKSIAVRALAGGHATGPWPWPWPEPRPFPE